jgi:hypothetical protein
VAGVKIAVFWVVAPCILYFTDVSEIPAAFTNMGAHRIGGGDSKSLGIFTPEYMAQQPRRQPISVDILH